MGLVIPYYRGEEYITQCLRSIEASVYPVSTIYLADNSPEPYLAPLPDQVRRLELPVAIGFGRACNAGIWRAIKDGHEYVMILNQDAVLAPDALGFLMEAMLIEETLVAVAPLSYDLALQKMSSKTYAHYVTPIPQLAKDLQEDTLRHFYAVDYNQINGACVCFRTEAIKNIPWFDPLFQQYGEDTEFFQRILYQYDGELAVVPKARLGHQHSNFTATGDRADWIAAQVRTGMLISWLKDPRRSWPRAILKAAIVALHTQWMHLRAGHIQRLSSFWQRDLEVLGKLGEIRRHRATAYLQQVVNDYLKNDLKQAWE